MIEFDTSEPLFTPGAFYGEHRELCDVCILTFSWQIFETAKQEFSCEQIGVIGACNGMKPIYGFRRNGKLYALYLCSVGSTLAATDVTEISWITGATKFIMFGSAGNLNSERTAGKYVIPTESFRDEGLSYHYLPPSDYIRIPTADRMAEIFDEVGAPYVKGRVWTTDAIYRETRAKTEARRSEGCLAVDMETAGVQAVCTYNGWELYVFLAPGDVLDAEQYSIGELRNVTHLPKNFELALAVAERI